MTSAEFIAWMERLGLTNPEAARWLGVSLRTIGNWRSGVVEVPMAVGFACLWLEQCRGTVSAQDIFA